MLSRVDVIMKNSIYAKDCESIYTVYIYLEVIFQVEAYLRIFKWEPFSLYKMEN